MTQSEVFWSLIKEIESYQFHGNPDLKRFRDSLVYSIDSYIDLYNLESTNKAELIQSISLKLKAYKEAIFALEELYYLS